MAFVAAAALAGMVAANFRPTPLMGAAGTVTLFAVSFINIRWGIYILTFAMLLSPEISVSETGGASLDRGVTLRLDDFLLLIIGLSWFAKAAYFKDLGLFRRTPLNRPIFAYVAVCVIATSLGILAGRASPKTGYLFVLKYIQYFIVYFMVANNLETQEDSRRFLICLLVTCLLASLAGIAQIPGGGRVSAPFEGAPGEPNTFGGYLLFVGMVAGGVFMASGSFSARVWLGGLLAVMIPPFLYTQSRSSYLAFLPALLTLGLLGRKPVIALMLILVIMGVSPLFLPDVVKERIAFTFSQPEERGQIRVGDFRVDTSTSARLESWMSAIRDWARHPLLGYGVTGYKFLDAQFPRVLVETGLLGLSAFLYLIYAIFRLALKNLRAESTPWMRGMIQGFIAGLVGLLFHSIGTNTFIIVRIMEPFWLVAGMVAVLPETRRDVSGVSNVSSLQNRALYLKNQ